MTKKKIAITIDADILEKIEIFVRENEDYLLKITSSDREKGVSTFINLILKAVLIPDNQLDLIMALDDDGDQNLENTIRHLIGNSINIHFDRTKRL